MKLPIDNVFWTQPIDAGGLFGKSLAATDRVKIWYVGHGVLVENIGRPPRLVPVSGVLMMEAKGGFETPSAAAAFDEAITAQVDGAIAGALAIAEPKKRGPGRPARG